MVAKRGGEWRAISTLFNSESPCQHALSRTQLAAGFTRSPVKPSPFALLLRQKQDRARPKLPELPDPFLLKTLPEVAIKKNDHYGMSGVKTETFPFLSSQVHNSKQTVIDGLG